MKKCNPACVGSFLNPISKIKRLEFHHKIHSLNSGWAVFVFPIFSGLLHIPSPRKSSFYTVHPQFLWISNVECIISTNFDTNTDSVIHIVHRLSTILHRFYTSDQQHQVISCGKPSNFLTITTHLLLSTRTQSCSPIPAGVQYRHDKFVLKEDVKWT